MANWRMKMRMIRETLCLICLCQALHKCLSSTNTATQISMPLRLQIPSLTPFCLAQLEQEPVFDEMLRNGRERVQGNCGCDISC